MAYYDTDQMLDTLGRAYEGEEQARGVIQEITLPYAVSDDFSILIIVQEKHATTDDQGLVQTLNMPPRENGSRKQVADFYHCDQESKSWSSFPIPDSFTVREMKYSGGVFSFIAADRRIISGTTGQIGKATLESSFAVNGVAETIIEKCFLNIPTTVVNPPQPKKTVAENPPIQDGIIGTLTFNEQHQWFETKYQTQDNAFEVYIDIDNRAETLEILPIVHTVLNRLETVDNTMRDFAAEQLLEAKNDNWREEDEPELTKDDFMSRMSIETISFDEDGEYEIWYADGDLFWGHSITVSVDRKGQPVRTDIHG